MTTEEILNCQGIWIYNHKESGNKENNLHTEWVPTFNSIILSIEFFI